VSGIAGILPPRGAPVDAALLARMAATMAYRGPDRQDVRALAGCGLVHALLDTGDSVDPSPAQPFSLDGRTWIVADARIDGRGELARALRAAGEDASPTDPATALLLRAYRAWGDACVDRLIGDFAFAVWDIERPRLFCARDALGIKPFYHAIAGADFVFSNTLDCVLLHPRVDAGIDEEALADFLVHGYVWDPERTIRRGVRALPAGHRMVVEEGRVSISRWWSLPRDEPMRLRGPAEYAERFVGVLHEAVKDRLPRGPASIFLSGGRDSPSVAALAVEEGTGLHGFTSYYERLIFDDEPRFAGMAGRALGIPITWQRADDHAPFERFESDPRLDRPEPVDSPNLAAEIDQRLQAAAHSRVVLTGLGGDPVLHETPSRLVRLAARGHLLRAGIEAAQYAWWHQRIPRPGLRTWLRARKGPPGGTSVVPEWIRPEFARRVALEERIAAQDAPPADPHPLHPEAAEQIGASFWQAVFAYGNPGATHVAAEERHPFVDVRVLRFTLAVPPAQWYNDKGLLRIGMRGRLPDPLLRRPKTPLREDPLEAYLREHGVAWLGGRTLGATLDPWIDASRVPRSAGGGGPEVAGPLWPHLKLMGLALWLHRRGLVHAPPAGLEAIER
jgi:asparagine synthase (glutamine-hydrolysing)